ncbi:acyl carrier protein [Sphingomonas sp. C3-2]|uniref:acyl carrier protein n=1 Tax=Sphingomonas sp. C3-2 TaxID=3062169 RepID=UPI00294AE83A|nr:acyl carrier protein [Sphingomonas sp. C3-2]WOK36580.1 acyl carrier protein [Sphingomonas sp. C3-2]
MRLTEATLIAHLRAELPDTEIQPTTALFSSGALDSLSMLNLICFVEDAIGHEIDAADVTLDNFDTVEAIVHYAQMPVW